MKLMLVVSVLYFYGGLANAAMPDGISSISCLRGEVEGNSIMKITLSEEVSHQLNERYWDEECDIAGYNNCEDSGTINRIDEVEFKIRARSERKEVRICEAMKDALEYNQSLEVCACQWVDKAWSSDDYVQVSCLTISATGHSSENIVKKYNDDRPMTRRQCYKDAVIMTPNSQRYIIDGLY